MQIRPTSSPRFGAVLTLTGPDRMGVEAMGQSVYKALEKPRKAKNSPHNLEENQLARAITKVRKALGTLKDYVQFLAIGQGAGRTEEGILDSAKLHPSMKLQERYFPTLPEAVDQQLSAMIKEEIQAIGDNAQGINHVTALC